MPKPKHHLFVCGQARPEGHPRGSCGTSGAAGVFQAFARLIADKKLFESIAINQTGCIGPCHLGANVLVYPEGVLYSSLAPEDAELIVEQHLINGEPVKEKFAPAEIW